MLNTPDLSHEIRTRLYGTGSIGDEDLASMYLIFQRAVHGSQLNHDLYPMHLVP